MKTFRILAVAGVLACAGCSQQSAPLSPTRTDVPMWAGARPADPAAAASATPSAEENQALAAVRQATAAFHDVASAVDAGYAAPDAAACVESPAGAMGVHSVNASLAGDQVIDALTPEVLLYLPMSNGGFRLVGVEYLQAVLVRDPETGVVSPWFAPTPWPASYEVLTSAPALFGRTFDGPMAGHEPGMPWHYDLHAWVWAPNPNGTLAQFNPRLSCAGTE